MNVLIADSGGTKTDWVFIYSEKTEFFSGSGLHPGYNSAEKILTELKIVVNKLHAMPEKVFFYGAGCHGREPVEKIRNSFSQVLPRCEAEIFDDLTGAARAHLGQTSGVIAILGTGSVCGRYSNGEITRRTASLGYAIGDEGSAADLGRLILKAFFRKKMNRETHDIVKKRLENGDYSHWMTRIYGSDYPNRQLAAVAGMIYNGEGTEQLRSILEGCVEGFLDSQFTLLSPEPDERIVFTGGLSVAQKDLLLTLLKRRSFSNCAVKSKLIDGLAEYHQL